MDSKIKTKHYSIQNIQVVCESLISARRFDRLETFIWTLPEDDECQTIEIVLISQAFLAYRRGNFTKLYDILQEKTYSHKYHRQLQLLWRESHYIEVEQKRGKSLGAVGKYRVRRKYPLPKTIWDGSNMSYCFQEEVRSILNKAYQKNSYPNSDEKYSLAESTNLTITQVSNWFKNKRQRARATEGKEASPIIKHEEEERSTDRINYTTLTEKYNLTQHYPPPLIRTTYDKSRPVKPTFYRVPPYPMYYPLNARYVRTPITWPRTYPRVENKICTCHKQI